MAGGKYLFISKGSKKPLYMKRSKKRRSRVPSKLAMIANSIENKRNTLDITASGVGTTAEFTILNGIAQGYTTGTRVGNKITMNYLTANFHLVCNASSTACFLRLSIVYDEQCNGAAPTFAEVFTPTQMYGLRDVDNSRRFKMIWDKTFCLDPVTNPHMNIRIAKKFNLETRYIGTTAVVSSIGTGSLYLIAVSSDNTYQPTVAAAIRTGYYDN